MMKKNEAGVKKGGGARVKIPARVESATLARFFAPGEPVVVLRLLGVGNTAPFYLQDKAGRILVLKWDCRAGAHVIRIPHSLWQADEARLAHDVMGQGRLVNAMIVTFELPELEKERVVAAAGAGAGAGAGAASGDADAAADAEGSRDACAAEAEEPALKETNAAATVTATACTAVRGSVMRTVSAPRAGRGRKAMGAGSE